MGEDSLKKRYFYKLSTNFINLVLNLVIQAIVPRALGPILYGSFSFLTNFFQQITGFFDLWTTPGFYIKLSQRPRETNLVSFVFLFFSICSVFLIVLISCISPDSIFYRQLWPSQELIFITMAAFWGLFTWFLQLLNSISDAYGLTVESEKMRMFQKFFGFIIILLLFVTHKLDLKSYFFYNYIIMMFLIASLLWIIRIKGYKVLNFKVPYEIIRGYIKEFYLFSSPMFLSGVVGLLCGLFDRWLLQFFSGSVQQGFFGLSSQIGMVCFIFTGAMTPLIMREFSIAFNKKNIDQISHLFRRYIPLLYSIAAYISCFITFQAAKIIYIMGGSQYKSASLVVAIMSIYPIHQTYGQLSGAVFLATGQTRLFANISIIFLLVGLPLTYFLIATKANMGLDAGAAGLAMKMVALQMIVVNIQLYFNSKYLKLNFWKYLLHQFVSVFVLLSISFLTMILFDKVLVINNQMFSFFLSGLVYSILVIILVYFKPVIIGLKKDDINFFIDQFRVRIG